MRLVRIRALVSYFIMQDDIKRSAGKSRQFPQQIGPVTDNVR